MVTWTRLTAVLAFGAAVLLGAAIPAGADGTKKVYRAGSSYAAKGGPRVRGYVLEKRGGYSYDPEDVANAYYSHKDARYLFSYPRQSISGPFDSGFFFDSAIRPRGGDAPYLN